MQKDVKIIFVIILLLISFFSCKENLPVIEDFSNEKFILINQSNQKINFPSQFRGKIIVVGYIFTNCPDICPLTTNNMRLIQERLKKDKINNVEFISISFDTKQDSPEVLRSFAEIRNLDLKNWQFAIGDPKTIDSLLKKAEVYVIPGDSTILKSGKKIFYYIHTDRIQLLDKNGKLRKNYTGSKINIDEIVNDIKNL